jgi:hypothetical protein
MKTNKTVLKALVLLIAMVFTVTISKAQCHIDGTWNSTSGSSYYVLYDDTYNVIGAINVSTGYIFIYDFDDSNIYDPRYECGYSSTGRGYGNIMKIYSSNLITVKSEGVLYAWTRSYNYWYSTPSYSYYNYYWNPTQFYNSNPQNNVNPLPTTNTKYNNITRPTTNPKNNTVPVNHTNIKK